MKLFLVEEAQPGAEVIRGALAGVEDVEIEEMSLAVAIARISAEVRTIPIVVVCDEHHVDAVLDAGAAECVTSPVRPCELAARVHAVLRERVAARAREQRERRKSDMIRSLRQEKEDLERLACVDALTGIANRRHAFALLDSEWKRSSREHFALGLVMIDLDCYHQYNEQYGHLGGDRCLQLVSEAMVRCLRRPSDYLGRYGGEEFLAVLPATDAAGAKLVAERLRARVEALAIPHHASACANIVTITAGFASLRVTPDLSMDRLIAIADAALLRAKGQGRNCIEGDAPLVRPSTLSPDRWQQFEPVHADPWFVDRIPAFLAEAHDVVQGVRHEPEQLARTARALRSSAHDLGLTIVERIVAELERAARALDVVRAREATDELIEYVTHVQVIYRRGDPGPTRALAI